MVKSKIIRTAPELNELANRIARERIILGKDRRMKSTRRITLAMTRHNLMKQIAYDIANSDLKDD